CPGHTGQPALPCMPTGEPQSADGEASNPPPKPCCLSLSSCTREMGGGMSRRVGRRQGRPQRNAKALTQSRMGHSSLRPVTPSTRGMCPMAKAPSLGKDGVQRETANKVPSERASCPQEWRLAKWDETRAHVPVDAVEMETDAA